MFLLKSDPSGLDLPTGRTDGRAAAALARAQGGCGPAGSCRLAARPGPAPRRHGPTRRRSPSPGPRASPLQAGPVNGLARQGAFRAWPLPGLRVRRTTGPFAERTAVPRLGVPLRPLADGNLGKSRLGAIVGKTATQVLLRFHSSWVNNARRDRRAG